MVVPGWGCSSGAGARAWDWLLSSSPSHLLPSIAPPLPPLLPTQPNTRSLLPVGHRMTPVLQDLNHGELLFI